MPVLLPIMKGQPWSGLLGISRVRREDVELWYGAIFMVNMQMGFLSSPFGYSLFSLKRVAPPQIPLATIFRSAVNVMALQWLGVGLCILFPQIVLGLPSVIYAGHRRPMLGGPAPSRRGGRPRLSGPATGRRAAVFPESFRKIYVRGAALGRVPFFQRARGCRPNWRKPRAWALVRPCGGATIIPD